ncbi:Transcription and mRNA export factor ENY2 [Capsicum chinense]|nr:Transcription and mRNA export factor ENY2 [Capsicum chinense]
MNQSTPKSHKGLQTTQLLSSENVSAGIAFCRRHSVNRPPTPDTRDDQEKEPTLKEIINIKLIESGEKERLMELLRERLVESGWKDEMKSLCR